MGEINQVFIYCCAPLSLLSCLSSALVVYAHFKIPQLHKHPGQMIVAICIVQIIFDLHWIGAIDSFSDKLVNSGACEIFGFIFNLLVYMSWNILACLAIELTIKVKYPLRTNYRSRIKIYSLLIFLVTCVEMLLTSLLGNFGLSVLGTCFLKDGSKGYWIALLVVFVNVPLIMYCVFLLVSSPGYINNKALQKTVRACVSMALTWGFPTLVAGLSTVFNRNLIFLNYISFLIGCSSGILLAVSRLASKEVFHRLWKGFLRSSRKSEIKRSALRDFNEILIAESSINDFYLNFTQYSITNLLLVLSLAFLTCQSCQENYSYSYKKRKFYYNEVDFTVLSNILPHILYKVEKNGIWEYEQEYFERIRSSCDVSTQDLIASICSENNFISLQNSNAGGRSGAFIFVTFDEKFVIKTVSRHERYFLLDILPAYCKRVTKHRESKIVRILGLFKVLNTKQSFVIMENIIRKKECMTVFDLKGSTHHRYTEPVPGCYSVLKDKNLIETCKKLLISHSQKAHLLKILKSDTKFMKKFQIIDYSLLIAFYEDTEKINSRYYLNGFNNSGYTLGLIDFLQHFTLFKKLEMLYKTLKCRKDVSICPPNAYSARFLKFIEDFL